MGPKILVPVLPTDRFFDAVVAAADILAERGGTLTFLFTTLKSPPLFAEKLPAQHESLAEVPPEKDYDEDLDAWRDGMVHGLDDARSLLYERGIGDEHVSVTFADFEVPTAQAIADEAAAGGYDLVVLARGEVVNVPDMPGESPADMASALEQLRDDGVRVLMT